MKRVILLVLAFACLLGLCACGKKEEAPTWQEQYDLGMRYLEEGNYKEAILAFTAAIEIDPNQALAYVGRGDAYVLSGETKRNLAAAQADYEKAIELDETLAAAYLGLAEVYVRQQKVESALDILRQGAGRIEENEALLEKLAQIEPAVVDVRFNRIESNDVEYAVITGVNSAGDTQWTYTTPKNGMTELTQTEEIGLRNGMYYFNEAGTVVALAPDSGNVIWKNNEFGGASISFAFGDDGDLFLAGSYGPDFFWVDTSGTTIKRIERVDARYYWPSEIRVRNGYVEIVMNGTASDGYGEQHIVTVNLNETSQNDPSVWRQAYLAYIQGDNLYGEALSDGTFQFQLIYIDNDDIPELWLSNYVIATGSMVCAFDGEQVHEEFISEYGNLQYIERGGLFYTRGGHSDIYWDGIFKVQNGRFIELAHGDFGAEDNSNIQFDENEMPIYQYSWNGRRMSEQEYASNLARAFDTSAARNVFHDPTYDYYQMQQILSE